MMGLIGRFDLPAAADGSTRTVPGGKWDDAAPMMVAKAVR